MDTMKQYKYNRDVYSALEGIAFRQADTSYMLERYGADGAAVELEENRKTVSGLFDYLDALAVPFWVQNAALAFGRDWRRYKSGSLSEWLAARGISPTAI